MCAAGCYTAMWQGKGKVRVWRQKMCVCVCAFVSINFLSSFASSSIGAFIVVVVGNIFQRNAQS